MYYTSAISIQSIRTPTLYSTPLASNWRRPQNIQEPHHSQPHSKLRLHTQIPPFLPMPNTFPQPHRNPSCLRGLRPLRQPIHPSPRCRWRRRRSFHRRLTRHCSALRLILRLRRFALCGQRHRLRRTVTIVSTGGIGACTGTGAGSCRG